MIPNELALVHAVAAEGYFTKAEAGDMRGASYFARLVAYRLNPAGDPRSFGWLKKGGGSNVDGYADDAIVFGSDPNNLQNVIDVVGGSGAPGARPVWNAGEGDRGLPRRASDVWDAPRPLTVEQMNYLKAGSGGGGGGGTGPNPDVQKVLDAIAALLAEVVANTNTQIASVNARLSGLTVQLASLHEAVANLELHVEAPDLAPILAVLKPLQADVETLRTQQYEARIPFGGTVIFKPRG